MKRNRANNDSVTTSADAFHSVGFAELQAMGTGGTKWLWRGYVAAGNVTLLTSRWKAGKTSLASVLLSRMAAGGELAGLAVAPGRCVVASEESPDHSAERGRTVAFGPNVEWLCRPFAARPTFDEWRSLIDALAADHRRRPLDLVVIDPLASFLPGRSENDAATVMEALLPLQRLTGQGVAVLVLHYPRKGQSAAGESARGSGALSGWADVLVEMGWPAGAAEDDRRRVLTARSRHDETPRRLVVEHSADGADYRAVAEEVGGLPGATEDVLLGVLEDAHGKLTRRQVARDWPADYVKPTEVTLWRWLERLVAEGRVLKDGTGRKDDPFRFWLRGQEARWRDDPLHFPDLPPLGERDVLRAARRVLKEAAE